MALSAHDIEVAALRAEVAATRVLLTATLPLTTRPLTCGGCQRRTVADYEQVRVRCIQTRARCALIRARLAADRARLRARQEAPCAASGPAR